MKKWLAVLALCILAGCSSKETVEVDYYNEKHNEIVDKILGNALGKDETRKVFEETDAIDVYYEKKDEGKVVLTLFNNMDYYYTGKVDFKVCPVAVSVKGLAPYGYANAEISCPDFVEDGEFTYEGQLFERNDDYKYETEFESYYYEEDDTIFDYALKLETISNEDIKELAKYLYSENVLSNYDGEMWVKVYPFEAYETAFNDGSETAWNELDANFMAAKLWIDASNDFVEIYAPNGTLIERVNYR